MSKQLVRSSHNKVIAGVCAGIANYFNIDPVIVRIIWAVAVLGYGIGGLLYLILWVVLPKR